MTSYEMVSLARAYARTCARRTAVNVLALYTEFDSTRQILALAELVHLGYTWPEAERIIKRYLRRNTDEKSRI